MPYLLNLLYLLLLILLSPMLVYRALRTGKYRRGLWTKLTGRVDIRSTSFLTPSAATVWFHGVSVGEIHLLRQVVSRYRQRHPAQRLVISTTTDTGFDEARRIFPDLEVIWWPLDFSWAVKTALRRVRPDLVVLAEGELWPNFLLLARRWGVQVAIINGRLSPRSARRYGKLRWLVGGLFRRLDLVAAQTAEYADHYCRLGADHVVVTGSVKYDGAASDRRNLKTEHLRALLGIGSEEMVWVAGSTQAPEEEIALGIYQSALSRFPNLRLILVPRQKDRFEEVAGLLLRSGMPFLRRSQLGVDGAAPGNAAPPKENPIILVDTIGELSAIWGLAEVAFVGGSLDGQRGGQNMIEPAAYGAAVLFGPHTWNFKDTVARLKEQQAALEVADAAALEDQVVRVLADADLRHALGGRAQRFVASQQGATERTLAALDSLFGPMRVQSKVA